MGERGGAGEGLFFFSKTKTFFGFLGGLGAFLGGLFVL